MQWFMGLFKLNKCDNEMKLQYNNINECVWKSFLYKKKKKIQQRLDTIQTFILIFFRLSPLTHFLPCALLSYTHAWLILFHFFLLLPPSPPFFWSYNFAHKFKLSWV